MERKYYWAHVIDNTKVYGLDPQIPKNEPMKYLVPEEYIEEWRKDPNIRIEEADFNDEAVIDAEERADYEEEHGDI
jgi:hypothetical protein